MLLLKTEAVARKREEFEQQMELDQEFMQENLDVLSKLAEGNDEPGAK